MASPSLRTGDRRGAFTLIELLVVMSIIALLMSILVPSLSRARDQAKGVHCVARLKELGTAIAAYENVSDGMLPPARWFPSGDDLAPDSGEVGRRDNKRPRTNPRDRERTVVEYGWAEILFSYVYAEKIQLTVNYPVQRNVEGERWEKYLICNAVGDTGVSSGHYRVYLPAWSAGSYVLEAGGRYGDSTRADPLYNARRERVPPKLPLIGDANERSERGDGQGCDDGSYIDAGEADYAGTDGVAGNRFSDRHYGGTNFLFQDLHAAWDRNLRRDLARDYDLNGVIDITEAP